METQLKEVSNDALNDQKISGFLCIDKNGLCLTASGEANEKNSGTIASIAQLAQKLDNSNKTPVVCIESEKRKILIRSVNQITTAVYKNNN